MLRQLMAKIQRDGFASLLRSIKVNIFWWLEGQILYHAPQLLWLCFRKPRFLYVELTNDCNLNCRMCPRNQNRQTGYMSFSLFKQVIDEATEIGGVSVKLLFAGESTLHPQFADMVRYVVARRSRFYKVDLTSNGTFWNRQIEDAALLLDNVTFSVDGVGEIYEGIRRGGKYDIVKRNILSFLKAKAGKLKPVVTVTTVISTQTNAQLRDIQNEWNPHGVAINFCGCINDRFGYVNPERFHKMNTRVYMDRAMPKCDFPYSMMAVLWNGDVTFCCHDFKAEGVIGNVYDRSLSELWKSIEFNFVRRGTHPLCVKCEKLRSLKGEN